MPRPSPGASGDGAPVEVHAVPFGAGGLGFLAGERIAFAPGILAQSALLSALLASRILFQGATLASFKYEIAALVTLQLVLVLGPRAVFALTPLALTVPPAEEILMKLLGMLL